MKKTLLFAVLAVAGYANAVTIDDFTTGTYDLTVKTGVTEGFQYGSMLGGNRGVWTTVLANPINRNSETNISDGYLTVDNGTQVVTHTEVGYGFADNGTGGWTVANLGLNYTGVPDIKVNFFANDRDLKVGLYLGSNGWTNVSNEFVTVAGNQDTPFTLDLSVAGLSTWVGAGVNLSQVDQVLFTFDTKPSGDFAVSSFESVPEPATMLALGLGALAFLRRRSK